MRFFKKKKVYCENCRYYFNDICTNKKLVVNKKDSYECRIYTIPHAKELNKHNNCKGFKAYIWS